MSEPINGNVATITLKSGCLVYVAAGVQSASLQNVVIRNLSTSGAVYAASGASVSKGEFKLLKADTFWTDTDLYAVEMNVNGRQAYIQSDSTSSLNGTDILQQYTFTTNDGGYPAGDNDFNDLWVSITCFDTRG